VRSIARAPEITVRGKGGKIRVVKISHGAARSHDRYIRVRARRSLGYRAQFGTINAGRLTSIMLPL
jgi:site-specific recombinase XerD